MGRNGGQGAILGANRMGRDMKVVKSGDMVRE